MRREQLSMQRPLVLLVLSLGAASAAGQGLPIKSGTTSDLMKVDTQGNARVSYGPSARATYMVSVSNQANTTAVTPVLVEAEAARGFRVTMLCITPGSQTTGASQLVQLMRTTTASSAGTVITAEVTTGNNGLSKFDPSDASWSGVARALGTPGTAGAIIDTFTIGVPPAAALDASPGEVCRRYCVTGEKCPTVQAGVTNGLKIAYTGATGGAGFSASLVFIAE
jgi:hypothetical protein